MVTFVPGSELNAVRLEMVTFVSGGELNAVRLEMVTFVRGGTFVQNREWLRQLNRTELNEVVLKVQLI